MLRLFGLLLIFIACTLTGFFYAESLRKRSLELKELERTLVQLKNEIMFLHSPLPEALKKIGERSKEPFSLLYIRISSYLEEGTCNSVFEATVKSLEDYKDILYLIKEDIEIIKDFSKNLGDLDRNFQINIFEMTLERVAMQIKDSEITAQNNIKLYRYLGLCIGALVVIFLI
ncbi:stage III sporulation protein SpoIIIAB [Desnuesiella massiliensis]|uniref:stage III sporulation protein SpoIIIAB n=1 Tax=Desnuesiella massiliensis TaxID=1650662 RepID=UPI0006E384EC|nr:stage III sporulation protein SpoIIIAB [Desnuesiella massiliensis]